MSFTNITNVVLNIQSVILTKEEPLIQEDSSLHCIPFRMTKVMYENGLLLIQILIFTNMFSSYH